MRMDTSEIIERLDNIDELRESEWPRIQDELVAADMEKFKKIIFGLKTRQGLLIIASILAFNKPFTTPFKAQG